MGHIRRVCPLVAGVAGPRLRAGPSRRLTRREASRSRHRPPPPARMLTEPVLDPAWDEDARGEHRRRRARVAVRAGRFGGRGRRAGRRAPAHGGCLCLAGDCGTVWRRSTAWPTCAPARRRPAGLVVQRPRRSAPRPSCHGATGSPHPREAVKGQRACDAIVIGAGGAGGRRRRAPAGGGGRDRAGCPRGRRGGRVLPGPTVVVRTTGTVVARRADEVGVATGAAEIQPVCPGNRLRGIVTASAAATLVAAASDLGRVVVVGDMATWPTPSADGGARTALRFEGVNGSSGGGRDGPRRGDVHV